ncbi:MAG: hypothetical protein JSW59_14260 [Phycisphaerales bacterium]|nr:MAG: hypothetical protein JSW59_14260 [Phycisphaerales bacterium]
MRPADNIEESIRKLRYKTDAETREKLLDNVLQTLDKREKQKSGVTKPDIWRTIMNAKTRKLATAAVILIAAAITLRYLVGPISTTSTVYAEVAERLHKALTMTYKMTTATPVEWMPEMEMKVAFKEPGLLRMTMAGGHVSVMDMVQGKALSIIPTTKQFVEIDLTNLPEGQEQDPFDAIQRLRSLPETADEELGEREIGGRTVQGFRVTEDGVTHTVWIDPKTREPIEIEIAMVNAPEITGTITDIRFNVELPDELFSITPPDGYTRQELQYDASEPTEDDLIEFLRLFSSLTQDNTFLPTLNPAELPNVVMEMAKAGKFGPDRPMEDKDFGLAMTMKVTRAMMFVMKLPAESNSHYAGENVKYGDAETAIFWYQPEGSQTYRVIYGDLSVKDVAPEDLPQ